jgi:hypothetical protein
VITFSTDIAPTVYAALGYRPKASNELMGSPLAGTDPAIWSQRRRAAHVFAASYGAVYAVVRDNGRRLYIADAINGGDFAYDRDQEGAWVPREVDGGTRLINQLAIRHYVDGIARMYSLNPRY